MSHFYWSHSHIDDAQFEQFARVHRESETCLLQPEIRVWVTQFPLTVTAQIVCKYTNVIRGGYN